jgi:putative pyruvate formate lyase activating enzyme
MEVAVSSDNLHFGEEPCLVGTGGSGTIFLTGCNLRCSFCQNYPISQIRHGKVVGSEWLADAMLRLQGEGAVNINFVSPTHWTAQIAEAVAIAREKGLVLPFVWNSGGYESVEVLRLLDGIVDIYLPDAKYSNSALAMELSGAPKYAEVNRAAILEMWRQVGKLRVSEGVATHGLLVRHLVLPGHLENTHGVLEFLSSVDKDLAVSVMCQYFPAHKAPEREGINRRLSHDEWEQVLEWVSELGINEGYMQQL